MSKSKLYKEQKTMEQTVGEPVVAYTNNKGGSAAVKARDDVRRAISGEELLNRLRPRIRELFQ